jgi:hypothetical protein
MVFNATFNNISVISWWSVLLVKETRIQMYQEKICCKSLKNFITQCCIVWIQEYTGHETILHIHNVYIYIKFILMLQCIVTKLNAAHKFSFKCIVSYLFSSIFLIDQGTEPYQIIKINKKIWHFNLE